MEYILSFMYWILIFINLEGDYRRSIRRNAQWAKDAYRKDLKVAFWFYIIIVGIGYWVFHYYGIEFVY